MLSGWSSPGLCGLTDGRGVIGRKPGANMNFAKNPFEIMLSVL
jgi:hypothetical protein